MQESERIQENASSETATEEVLLKLCEAESQYLFLDIFSSFLLIN